MFTSKQDIMFTTDSINLVNMLTHNSANMFTSESATMFTNDSATMFTNDLTNIPVIWQIYS